LEFGFLGFLTKGGRVNFGTEEIGELRLFYPKERRQKRKPRALRRFGETSLISGKERILGKRGWILLLFFLPFKKGGG